MVETVASWVAIGISVVGGAVWVGSQSNEIVNLKQTVDNHSQRMVPESQDVAVLKSQISSIQADMAGLKLGQKEILEEIRKR